MKVVGTSSIDHLRGRGFTIVELLIVVVVIAILAAVTIVAYTGIQRSAQLSALKSEVANAAKSVETTNATTGAYPTSLPASVPVSSTVQLSLSEQAGGYCVNAHLKNDLSVQWRYSSAGGLQEGLCPGQVIAGSEQGLSPNLITNQNFTSGWDGSFQNAAGRTFSTRPGTVGDPYPTRPVLTLQNTGTTATSWALVRSTAIDRSQIISGQTYERGYWVRKVGNYSGGTAGYGVLDSNATNISLSNGTFVTTQDSWQYITHRTAALQTPPSSNVLYLITNNVAYTTPGWTLEFQGFELRRVQ